MIGAVAVWLAVVCRGSASVCITDNTHDGCAADTMGQCRAYSANQAAVARQLKVVLEAHPQLTVSPELVQNEAALDLLMKGVDALECLKGLTRAVKIELLAAALGTICKERCGCSLAGREHLPCTCRTKC